MDETNQGTTWPFFEVLGKALEYFEGMFVDFWGYFTQFYGILRYFLYITLFYASLP